MFNWIRSKHHKQYLSGAQAKPEGRILESHVQRETVARESVRRRPIGRIAGVLAADPQAQRALCAAVSSDYQILVPDSEKECVIADWDCCELDGRPVTELWEWWPVIRNGRLGDVHGAFVLAWTDATGCLCLARDAIGERSLYYAALPGGGFAFASSLSVLVDSALVTPILNLHTVALYLSCAYVPTSQTLVDGIQELPPGEVLQWRDGAITLRRFWEVPTDSPTETAVDEACEQANLRRWLEVAIRRRLPTEGDVAAFLSGGIDSSLIVALLRHLYDGAIVTLSVTFGAEYPNELAFSSAVARHCGVRHHIVELQPSSIMQNLDSTIALLSQPIGDPLTVPNALLFQEAAQISGCVFNGEGGDPCFGGPKNLPMFLSELYGQRSEDRHERARWYLRAHLKCFDDLQEMMAPDAYAAAVAAPLEADFTDALYDDRWRSFLARLQAMNIVRKGAHHILPKVDQLSAPYGILPRSPLFDRSVVERTSPVSLRDKCRGMRLPSRCSKLMHRKENC
jgi:asparagine synthase (glutamine-hydrolysing)